ncbi:MAG: hypothetical protein AAGD07_19045 [Planctomycetota bacterium]
MCDDLAIVTCYFNPCGYRNREIGYARFVEGLARQGVSPWTMEATLPGQERFVPEGDRVFHVELPAHDWLWQKERLLNLLVQQLPGDISKVAWVDCDLLFTNDQWPRLTSQALDTWPVIQLFEFAFWLGPQDEILSWQGKADRRASLACLAMHYPDRAQDFRICTPGFAWAAQRSLLEKHGLYEFEVTGGGDTMISLALYGWLDHPFLHTGTRAMIHDGKNYARSLYQDVKGYVGYIPNHIKHLWHGSYESRNYVDRRLKLQELKLDPFRDLCYDNETKLLRWTEFANPQLREYVRSYFRSRREDDCGLASSVSNVE